MRTSTEFISEISAPTISTSFKFHFLHFLVKLGVEGGGEGGKVCILCVCVCVCALLSRSLVTPRHRFVMMHEVDTYKDRF